MKINYFVLLFVIPLWSQSPAGINGEKFWFNAATYLSESTIEVDSIIKDTSQRKKSMFNFHEALVFEGKSGIQMPLPSSLGYVKRVNAYIIYQSEGDSIEQSLWSLQSKALDMSLTTSHINSFQKKVPYTNGHSKIPVMSRYYEKWRKLPVVKNTEADYNIYLGEAAPKDSLLQKFKGSISEFIFYDRKLRSGERALLETYLALKYGITINRDYVDSDENILWSVEDNKDYAYRIAGIGKDSLTRINQKQAHTVENQNTLVISAGSLQENNQKNTTKLNHGDFLIWGDDNGIIELEKRTDAKLPLLNRKWLMQRNGTTSSDIVTEVSIDPTYFFPDTSIQGEKHEYVLVIDRSGSGEFDIGQIETIYADPDPKNGIYMFHNVQWDLDGSGTDNFTFTRIPVLKARLESIEKTDCETPIDSDGILYEVTGGWPPYQYELLNTDSSYQKKWDDTNDIKPKKKIDNPDAGFHQFTVTDNLGRKAKDTITIAPYKFLKINLGKDRVLGNVPIILDAAAQIDQKEVSYTWGSDQGLTHSEPKLTVEIAGTYTVTVTDEYGCTATDEISIFPSVIEKFVVYPNSSEDGSYTIKVFLKETSSGIRLNVYDTQGHLYDTQAIEGQSTHFEFQGIIQGPSGLYTMHIVSPRINAISKFLKK